jgi:phage baseplate assembly protein W
MDSNTSNFDKTAVQTSLNNLFNFRLGEAILEPMYGNNLYVYLYEVMNKYTAEKIARTLRQMIENWEPRIEIDDLDIVCNEEEMTYYITIHYHIPELHASDVYKLNLSK